MHLEAGADQFCALLHELEAEIAAATGGDGSDTFSGLENLTGSAFNDTLTGDGNANVLSGLGGVDTLVGGAGVDTISGGDANDTITGGTGNDTLDGGLGNDTFNFASGDGVDTISGFTAGGTDDTIVVTGFSSYTLSQEGANLRIVLDGSNSILLNNVLAANFTAADINIPLAGGGPTTGDDTLTGTAGADSIDALAGNDTVNGLAGNDTLLGNAGNDILNGGADNDTLNGGADIDTVTYADAGAGVTVSLATTSAQNRPNSATSLSVSVVLPEFFQPVMPKTRRPGRAGASIDIADPAGDPDDV